MNTLYITLNNVQDELSHIEKQIQKIKEQLDVKLIQNQNGYMIQELNNMLSEYSREENSTTQKITSKIRRILYKIKEMENKDVQHGERPRV